MPRNRLCTPEVREGRLDKAKQLAAVARDMADLADEAREVADAYVTLLVHAGIAAEDEDPSWLRAHPSLAG